VSPFVRTTQARRVRARSKPVWAVRLARALRGRSVTIDGVRYRERRPESLPRALMRHARTLRVYSVRFPNGESMRIRATARRVYDDLAPAGAGRLTLYQMCDELLRPGMRVLDLSAGTGAAAAWIARRVGPSGAVVALERDTESVRYARRRHMLGVGVRHVAFEIGHLEALAGELDGSFDAVFAVHAVRTRDDAEAIFRELRRLVAAGGWILAGAPATVPPPTPGAGDDGIEARTLRPDELVSWLSGMGTVDVLSRAVGQPAVVLARSGEPPKGRGAEVPAPPPVGPPDGTGHATDAEDEDSAHGRGDPRAPWRPSERPENPPEPPAA